MSPNDDPPLSTHGIGHEVTQDTRPSAVKNISYSRQGVRLHLTWSPPEHKLSTGRYYILLYMASNRKMSLFQKLVGGYLCRKFNRLHWEPLKSAAVDIFWPISIPLVAVLSAEGTILTQGTKTPFGIEEPRSYGKHLFWRFKRRPAGVSECAVVISQETILKRYGIQRQSKLRPVLFMTVCIAFLTLMACIGTISPEKARAASKELDKLQQTAYQSNTLVLDEEAKPTSIIPNTEGLPARSFDLPHPLPERTDKKSFREVKRTVENGRVVFDYEVDIRAQVSQSLSIEELQRMLDEAKKSLPQKEEALVTIAPQAPRPEIKRDEAVHPAVSNAKRLPLRFRNEAPRINVEPGTESWVLIPSNRRPVFDSPTLADPDIEIWASSNGMLVPVNRINPGYWESDWLVITGKKSTLVVLSYADRHL